MTKRILVFFLAAVLCLGLGGQAFAAQELQGELLEESGGTDRVDPEDSPTNYVTGRLNTAELALSNLLNATLS